MDSRIYMLVHKELTGEITPIEAEELQSLQDETGGADLAQDVSLIWNVSKEYFPRQDWNKGSAKAQFLNKIKSGQLDTPVTPIVNKIATPKSGTSFSSFWKIGVGVLALLALSFLGYKYLSGDEILPHDAPSEIEAKDEIEYAMLDDGTQIWLSPGSSVSKVALSSDSRSVVLQGEAFFDVSHDPNRRFNINLGEGVNIEVLGTSFKVVSADSDGTGRVSVRDGKVRLYSTVGKKNITILGAGETGELNARQNHVEKYRTDDVLVLGNIGDLSLKNLPLNQVFDKLGDYYGINIKNSDARLDCNFNSPLTGDPTIGEVIDIISAVYPNLKFKEQNRSTYQVSGSCK